MCGIAGVFGNRNAPVMVALALRALQHRGEESAGIAIRDEEGAVLTYRAMGLVQDVFTPQVLGRLRSDAAIGHVRYSTTGPSLVSNAQPIGGHYHQGSMAVAHNGHLENFGELRRCLEEEGAVFQSSMDTEVILHLLAAAASVHAGEGSGRGGRTSPARGRPDGESIGKGEAWDDLLVDPLAKLRGAWSLLIISNDGTIIAARDPHGFRPLVWGRLPEGDGVAVASESCALDLLGAQSVEEVAPGEALIIGDDGVRVVPLAGMQEPLLDTQRRGSHARCLFELVYFARPDSVVFGRDVYGFRKELGRRLAQEATAPVDCVLPVPDSGIPAALGYSQARGIPLELGLIRSQYVGRTFIQPRAGLRHLGAKLKLSVVSQVVRNRHLAVVDDSVVRATTARRIVTMLRDAGAKSVHLCVASPPVRFPCRYGIDTPSVDELAASWGEDEVLRRIGADSISWLSVSSMEEAAGDEESRPGCKGFCTACWSGDYPTGRHDRSSFQCQ